MEHDYLSTACLHQLHDQCRLVCKFCDAPCSCSCHTDRRGPDHDRLRKPSRHLSATGVAL